MTEVMFQGPGTVHAASLTRLLLTLQRIHVIIVTPGPFFPAVTTDNVCSGRGKKKEKL